MGAIAMTTPYRVVTFKELLTATNNLDMVFVDTETVELYGEIRLLQVYHKSLNTVLIVDRPNPMQLAGWLINRKHAWHNAAYDISAIQKHSSNSFLPTDYEDTFLLSRLTFCKEQKFSLDAVFTYVLGHDPYEAQGLDKKKLQKSDWSGHITEDQYLYAATDVYHMPALYEKVKGAKSSVSCRLDMKTLDYCLRFQTNGLSTDQDRIAKRIITNTKRIDEIGLDINVNSWQQVRKYLNSTESDALALAKMTILGGDQGLKASDVRETRGLLRQITFLNKWMEDRIYGYFRPSARSGRLTCSDQNLQQLPRKLKGMFSATDGKVYIRADFSQLELRGGCGIIGDRIMETLFRNKEDLHDFTATALFGINFTPLQRQIAKKCNFNLLYGGSANMLGKILIAEADILLSARELNRHRNKWLNLFPGVKRWQQVRTSDWRSGRLGGTPFGRKYLGNLYTDQMNLEVQGFGSEVAKLALHYMYDKILNVSSGALLCNFVHDDYMVEAPDDPECYKPIAKVIASSMQEAWHEASATLKIPDLPMPVDVTVGYNWGDMEAGENIIYELNQAA